MVDSGARAPESGGQCRHPVATAHSRQASVNRPVLPASPTPIHISCRDQPHPGCLCHRSGRPFSIRGAEQALRDAAAGTNGDPIPRPLSIAVHFPSRMRPGEAAADEPHGEAYLARLRGELALLSPLFDRDRQVEQVHLINQPLAHLAATRIRDLLDTLAHHFSFAVTGAALRLVELDPLATTTGDVAALAAIGINHAAIFIGVAASNAPDDPAIRAARTLIETCRQHGIVHVHVHLSAGDGPVAETPIRAIESVMAARVDRISLHHALREPEAGADTGASTFAPGRREALFARLLEGGYRHVGLCCFALPHDELLEARRHRTLHCDLLGYSAHPGSDLVGIGVGGNSHVGVTLFQNPRDPASWEASIDAGRLPVWRAARLGAEDLARADVVQQLVCRGEIDFEEVARYHGIVFREHFSRALERLQPLVTRGLAEFLPHGIRATSAGERHLHLLTACFDERHGDAIGTPPPHLARFP